MNNNYQNFRAAVYVRALDIAPLGEDITPFKEQFEKFNQFIKVGKVYLETHRDMIIPAESTLMAVREYLNNLGVETSAGITATIDEKNNLKTYCYSDPFYRQKMTEVVTLSARLFDEIVFDDFFFTNCKCPMCIEAKGKKSWTDFRLEQMTEASKELVLKPARATNPKVEVVIKYPNWYEHFQGLGFNLKDQPALYEGIYTGNETRDPGRGAQHLQPYESYLVYRYYENIKPGCNRGGWVDPFRCLSLDRYAEQLWLTLFAKSKEITLFDYFSLQLPITESLRGEWQGKGSSFDFDATTAPVRDSDGKLQKGANMSVAAGAALAHVDQVLSHLGNPIGVKSYKPYQSHGEDFLHNYLGMLGIPMDLVPEFPEDEQTLILTESAKFDEGIIEKIKTMLMVGKTVFMTSGLFRALEDKGFGDIVEMTFTNRKLTTKDYQIGRVNTYTGEEPITVSVIEYLTNDSWEEVSCNTKAAGATLLHSAGYGRSRLYILNVPDNYGDLYNLPTEVLTHIKEIVTKEMYVRLEAPSQVALFVYDNETFIVESFREEAVDVRLVLDDKYSKVKDVLSEVLLTCEANSEKESKLNKTGVDFTIKPHSFQVFKAN